jgi:hypothetical protein
MDPSSGTSPSVTSRPSTRSSSRAWGGVRWDPIDVWRHRVTLVINLAYLAGIVLVPVGLAALFIRLSRRFLSS